jgi:hypothetical protein
MKNWESGNKNKGSGKINSERASKKKDGGSPFNLRFKHLLANIKIQQFS